MDEQGQAAESPLGAVAVGDVSRYAAITRGRPWEELSLDEQSQVRKLFVADTNQTEEDRVRVAKLDTWVDTTRTMVDLLRL
jgi:hypothetical protein